MSTKTKIFIGIGIVAAIGVGYYFYTKNDTPKPTKPTDGTVTVQPIRLGSKVPVIAPQRS